MAQFVVRQIEDAVKVRLQQRAKRHGRSMEEEVRQILRSAAREDQRSAPKVGTRIAARFKKVGLTSDLPELRGEPARPADFDR